MLACDAPQNSAHLPEYSPTESARNAIRVTCPGVASRLPASAGTQNEWITSAEVIDSCTGLPTGTCISFAVRIPRFGYLYSHHHWCPITSTLTASGGASPAVARMVRIVGTATSTRITAGASVQQISKIGRAHV